MRKMQNVPKVFLTTLVVEFFILIFHSAYASVLSVRETSTNYVIENGRFVATISRANGMVESMQLIGSDFEMATDYPNYSIFFPEFLYEHPDGLAGTFYFPSTDHGTVTTNVIQFEDLVIVEAVWTTGKIDSFWEYFFEPDKPFFRVVITREVVLDGVYSNFQQCTMYNSDMDNSFIVNYQGQIELTMGDYFGERPYVAPFREGADYLTVNAQHSLWTVFDYGRPTYFPTMAWSDNESKTHAGFIVTYTSPNQRESISYHGGGATVRHPGYAEGQINWFGKSDSESLFLRKGTEFSMELYFYQNYGSIDVLWDFSENLLSQYYEYILPENYVVASWGGRTSPYERYFWRFPQVSSNYITSQELFLHKCFSIPRSQSGIGDVHLFSLNLVHLDGSQQTELTPIQGVTPLFKELWIDADDTSYTGGMSWHVEDFYSELSYKAYPHQRHVTVLGEVHNNDELSGANFIEFPLSSRTQELFVDDENMLFSFIASDSLLDTVSIGLTHVIGVDSFFTRNGTLFMRLAKTSEEFGRFQFDLYPAIQKAFRCNAQIEEIENQSAKPYKAHFVNTIGNSGISYMPSSKYFLMDDHKIGDILMFDVYASEPTNSLVIAIDDPTSDVCLSTCMVSIFTDDGVNSSAKFSAYGLKKYILHYTFNSCTLYHIMINCQNNVISLGDISIISIYPNPFNGITTLRFFMNRAESASYEIYNTKGDRVLKSLWKLYSFGYQEEIIDMTQYSSSVYFCKLSTASESIVSKLVMIK